VVTPVLNSIDTTLAPVLNTVDAATAPVLTTVDAVTAPVLKPIDMKLTPIVATVDTMIPTSIVSAVKPIVEAAPPGQGDALSSALLEDAGISNAGPSGDASGPTNSGNPVVPAPTASSVSSTVGDLGHVLGADLGTSVQASRVSAPLLNTASIALPPVSTALSVFFTTAEQDQAPPNRVADFVSADLAAEMPEAALVALAQPLDGPAGGNAPAANLAVNALPGATVVGPVGADAPAAKTAELLTVSLPSGDQLADGTGFDLAALEQQVQQLLTQADNLRYDLRDWVTSLGVAPWMIGLILAVAATYQVHRHFTRNHRQGLAKALADNEDAALWLQNLDAHLSSEPS
jgi:hypothetical protein